MGSENTSSSGTQGVRRCKLRPKKIINQTCSLHLSRSGSCEVIGAWAICFCFLDPNGLRGLGLPVMPFYLFLGQGSQTKRLSSSFEGFCEPFRVGRGRNVLPWVGQVGKWLATMGSNPLTGLVPVNRGTFLGGLPPRLPTTY